MILEEETFQKFGYRSDVLSKSSNKYVILLCDYCKIGTKESTINNRKTANAVVDKDACKICRPIKTGDINLIKIGVRNVFQRKDVKAKITETNLEKYGVKSPAQNKDVMAKMNQTSLDRYGTKNPMQSDEVKERHKQNCLDKYGVENVSSVEEFKEKKRETCLEKFGKDTYLGSEDCKIKTRETTGVDNVFQLDSVKEKSKKTMIERYGVDNMMKLPEIAELNAEKCLKTKIERGILEVHEDKTQADWAKITGFSRSRFSVLVKQYGWDLAIKMTPKMSSLEKMMEDWLLSINIKFDKQVKIGKYYADFVIGDVILELNGNYWHSEHHKANDYHILKREFYVENGYKPLFFMEDELLDKFDIVKSVILNKVGMSDRYFARKLKVEQISKDEGSQFLKENHLMGAGRGECFALKDGEIILSVMRMCKIKDGWEISRFANKLGKSVVGGFSRLLSFFTVGFAPEKIVTFIDLRYGSGEYLTSFGFIKGKSYPSFKWTDGRSTFHRMKFPSNTGRDSGLYKIWDCGQLKFIK